MIAEPIQGVGGFITPPKEYSRSPSPSSRNTAETLSPTKSRPAGAVPAKAGSASSTGRSSPTSSPPPSPSATLPHRPHRRHARSRQRLPGSHIATFGGNPIACVTASAVIDLIEEDDLIRNCDSRRHLISRRPARSPKEIPRHRRRPRLGLMQAMELVTDPKTKEPAAALATEMLEAARERGLLIGKGGMYNNVPHVSRHEHRQVRRRRSPPPARSKLRRRHPESHGHRLKLTQKRIA